MLTVGHSTLPIEAFLHALKKNNVELLADVRTMPRSRHNPQFGTEAVAESLEDAGIGYRWMRELGGLRPPKRDSINTGWRNASFRGYADYMQTAAFSDALKELIVLDEQVRIAIMCAEAVPWRCHRSLIADAFLSCGRQVQDLFITAPSPAHPAGTSVCKPHKLTPFARIEGARLWYPEPDEKIDSAPDRII